MPVHRPQIGSNQSNFCSNRSIQNSKLRLSKPLHHYRSLDPISLTIFGGTHAAPLDDPSIPLVSSRPVCNLLCRRRWHSILGLWRHRRAADYDEQSSDAHPETVASQTATVRRLFLRLDRSFTFFPGTSWVSTHETKDVPKSVRFPREDRRPHEDACLFRSGVSSVRESSEEILGIKVADGRDLPRPRRRYRYSGAMLCHPKYFPKFFSW